MYLLFKNQGRRERLSRYLFLKALALDRNEQGKVHLYLTYIFGYGLGLAFIESSPILVAVHAILFVLGAIGIGAQHLIIKIVFPD